MNTQLAIDHIIFAVPDLVAGIEAITNLTGIHPQHGGSHPGAGTANALLSLGSNVYLEVIGPDPQQDIPPQWFGVEKLRTGRLAGWAARTPDLRKRVAHAVQRGYDPGPIRQGERARPDGTLLRWQLAFPESGVPAGDGLVPFLIDWRDSAHPAEQAPAGCRLVNLRGEHPHPEAVRAMLAALGADLPVTRGPDPRLRATLETARGQIELM